MRRRLPGMIPEVPTGLVSRRAAMGPIMAEPTDQDMLADLLAPRIGIPKAALVEALAGAGLALVQSTNGALPGINVKESR